MKKLTFKESEIPRIKQSEVNEDIFLKKDQKTEKLVIFSDKDEKRDKVKETIGLSKEFRKLGFDWKPDLGHWVGDYSKLDEINVLIKGHNKLRKIIDDLEMIEDFMEDTDVEASSKNLIMDKLDMYITDLANATDQAAMDAAIRNYLTFYSKFHSYSLTNSFLIWLQKKDASKVAGYNVWKKKNRGVKKGATPIWIWFPMQVKSADQTDTTNVNFGEVDDAVRKGETITRFSMGKVYDISDTYALNDKGEIPDVPKWYAENEPSEVADELVNRLKAFADTLKIKITQDDAKGGEKGFSAGEHINLSSDVSGVAAASTLVHELAHELLHWKEKSPFHIDNDPSLKARDMQELQAESVSYAVLKYFELPVVQHPTYLVLWKANKEKIMKNLQIIVKCSKFIIDGIESVGEEKK